MTASSECIPVRAIGELDPNVLNARSQLFVQAAAYMTPECWMAERHVAQTKWFDYRFLSPVEATLKFVEEYKRAFRIKWKLLDSEVVDKKRGTASGGLWHDRQEFSTFWNARFHADLLGIDYFIYCSNNMETALRRAKQKRLLRPGQMRSADCVKAVETHWEDWLANVRSSSELSHYRTENFCGLPDQLAHQQHVARMIRKKQNGAIALGVAIDMQRVLPARLAEEIFGEEPVVMARERVMGIGSPVSVEHVADEQLIPSCFGLPVPLDVDAEPCCECQLAAQCARASESTRTAVRARYGTGNPVLAHKRAAAAERKRQQRRRDKEKAAEGGPIERHAEELGEAA